MDGGRQSFLSDVDKFRKVFRFLRDEGTDGQKENLHIYYAAQDRAIKELYQALGR